MYAYATAQSLVQVLNQEIEARQRAGGECKARRIDDEFQRRLERTRDIEGLRSQVRGQSWCRTAESQGLPFVKLMTQTLQLDPQRFWIRDLRWWRL